MEERNSAQITVDVHPCDWPALALLLRDNLNSATIDTAVFLSMLNAMGVHYRIHGGPDKRLEPLPSQAWTGVLVVNNNCTACPVCLDCIEPGSKVTRLLCGHLFHADCVHTHITYNNNCPVCRRVVSVQYKPS